MTKGEQVRLDPEWIELILEAKWMGYSIEDIRAFLEKEEVPRCD
ncbi:anti-repressor SinI family protein [Pontibacillus salicampi]|uniref:Anti-repressor SinI family protein n=1 Tax=Pontibacillus salicampi TaxID=1449801 RepID=A0ABV6LPH8_9BACI